MRIAVDLDHASCTTCMLGCQTCGVTQNESLTMVAAFDPDDLWSFEGTHVSRAFFLATWAIPKGPSKQPC